MDDDDEVAMIYESNPWLCNNASMLMPMCVGIVSSGSGMSPVRYCITVLMLGLTLANGCEHSNPTLNVRLNSFTS